VEGDIPEVESRDNEESKGDPEDSSAAKLSTVQVDGAFRARARRRSFRPVGFGLGFGLGFVALGSIVAVLELAAVALSGGLGSAVGNLAKVLRSGVMHRSRASAGSLVLAVRALGAIAEADLYTRGKCMFLVHRSSLVTSILGLVSSILGFVASILSLVASIRGFLRCAVAAGVLLCSVSGAGAGVGLTLGEGKKGEGEGKLHVGW